jgi:Uma2 family endonuclease
MPESLADLLRRLGDVPPSRIRLRPPPGTATEKDVVKARRTPERWLCELAEGTLIDYAYGLPQSVLGGIISSRLLGYLEGKGRGVVLGAGTAFRLRPGLVRRPRVSFVSWDRVPGEELPEGEIADLVPDLAVEVPGIGHGEGETARKVRDYFEAGVGQVWIVHERARTAAVYTAPDAVRLIDRAGSIDGGDLFPGFTLSLPELFARLKV